MTPLFGVGSRSSSFTKHSQAEHSVPDEPAADAKLLALLETNLASMPPDERQLVESKYLERRSVREIAEELETSEKAIESRLVRVRRKLKSALLEALKHE